MLGLGSLQLVSTKVCVLGLGSLRLVSTKVCVLGLGSLRFRASGFCVLGLPPQPVELTARPPQSFRRPPSPPASAYTAAPYSGGSSSLLLKCECLMAGAQWEVSALMTPVSPASARSPGLGGTRRPSSVEQAAQHHVLGVRPAHGGPGGRVVPDSCLSRVELSPSCIRPVLYASSP